MAEILYNYNSSGENFGLTSHKDRIKIIPIHEISILKRGGGMCRMRS